MRDEDTWEYQRWLIAIEAAESWHDPSQGDFGTPATLDRWRRSFALVCPFLGSCASHWRTCLSVIGLKLLALAIIAVMHNGTAFINAHVGSWPN